MNNPAHTAHLTIGDLAELQHHLLQAEHYRSQAIERLQTLLDEGHVDEVEKIRQSPAYQELMAEAEATLKNTSGC